MAAARAKTAGKRGDDNVHSTAAATCAVVTDPALERAVLAVEQTLLGMLTDCSFSKLQFSTSHFMYTNQVTRCTLNLPGALYNENSPPPTYLHLIMLCSPTGRSVGRLVGQAEFE